MNIFKKAGTKISAKKDMDIVVSYIKAELKSVLDSARLEQNTKMKVNLNDKLLTQASQFLDSVINDINEIKKHTKIEKETLSKSKTKEANGLLSPDENFIIDMAAIKDIKKAGLKRLLTTDERRLLKTATQRFNQVYSEQVKTLKSRE